MRRLVEAVLPARMGTPFRWLVGSSWISNLGDGIGLAAGPLLIASQTQDPLLVALGALLQRLPWLLLGLYAGVLADRIDRRAMVVAVDLMRYADGTGTDHLDGRGGDDAIYGGQGDRLSGGDGGDQLFADTDSRRPKGAHRVTYMSGGDGEDYVPVPPSGSSVVDCGSGDDATTVAPPASAAAAPSCEFYAGHEGLADPLWLGRAARVIGDTIEVTLRWRRREPLAFTAKMTGQASDLFVVLAEATGLLEPGDSVVQMPFTEAGRRHGGWTSEPHGLAVHHPGQGAGQPFGGTLPSGAVTAGGP